MESYKTLPTGLVSTLLTPFKATELSAKNAETPCFKLNPQCYEANENLSNPSSPLDSSYTITSPLISSNPHLELDFGDEMDPKSPTKRPRPSSSPWTKKTSEPLLTDTSTPDICSIKLDLPELEFSHLHLEPIHCDLDSPLVEVAPAVPALLFSPQSPTNSGKIPMHEEESEEEEEEEELFEAPESPSQRRLSPSRLAAAPSSFKISEEPPRHHHHQQQQQTTQLAPHHHHHRLQPPTVLSSIQPLFERPLYQKRSAAPVQTLSRIPKPPERTLPSTAAPGIRMPDSMHLDYATKERPGPFVTRLDLKRESEPRCSAYLTSPYPRLTKSAMHSVEFYEQRLAQSSEISIAPHATPKPSRTPSKYRPIHHRTPPKSQQKRPEPPTCMSTGLGKRHLSRKATVPVSPKLATAARNRKCQCCANGIHGVKPLQTAAQTTLGKRQSSMRRRPSPGPVGGRSRSRLTTPLATPSATPFKTPAKANLHVRFGPLSYDNDDSDGPHSDKNHSHMPHQHDHRHGSATPKRTPVTSTQTPRTLTSALKSSVPVAGSSAASSSTSAVATPSGTTASASKRAKPVLNLTTSLPEFKQPLASLIEPSTPGPSRQEVDAKLRTPLPVYVPPPTVKQAPALVRLPRLEEALGPNFHLVHAYTSSHPFDQPFAMDSSPRDVSATPSKDKMSH